MSLNMTGENRTPCNALPAASRHDAARHHLGQCSRSGAMTLEAQLS